MPFDRNYLQRLFGELRAKGVVTQPGLSDEEISRVEHAYDFELPPDLRELLQFALPISEGFPNWRRDWVARPILDWEDVMQGKPAVLGHNLVPIREQLGWISEGICFDIERNDFWMYEWGPRPTDPVAALEVAQRQLAHAPKLIPVYSHRYLPSEPSESGNPVFSVHQTDIIYYGFDLASYFTHEFEVFSPDWAATEPREIPYWSLFTR